MRTSPDPPWYWKPWITPWGKIREFWYRERPVSGDQFRQWARRQAEREIAADYRHASPVALRLSARRIFRED